MGARDGGGERDRICANMKGKKMVRADGEKGKRRVGGETHTDQEKCPFFNFPTAQMKC